MNSNALVELTVRYGAFRQHHKTLVVNISDLDARDLMREVELSDEPMSLLLASPGLFGGKGCALTVRKRTFEMRESMARRIADAMVPALVKAFGANDKIDGYSLEEADKIGRHV